LVSAVNIELRIQAVFPKVFPAVIAVRILVSQAVHILLQLMADAAPYFRPEKPVDAARPQGTVEKPQMAKINMIQPGQC
jgi:hypothetical protein